MRELAVPHLRGGRQPSKKPGRPGFFSSQAYALLGSASVARSATTICITSKGLNQ